MRGVEKQSNVPNVLAGIADCIKRYILLVVRKRIYNCQQFVIVN